MPARHADHPELVRLLLYEGLMSDTGSVPNDDARTAHTRDKVKAVRAFQSRAGWTPLSIPVTW
jgi:hypothetical protein